MSASKRRAAVAAVLLGGLVSAPFPAATAAPEDAMTEALATYRAEAANRARLADLHDMNGPYVALQAVSQNQKKPRPPDPAAGGDFPPQIERWRPLIRRHFAPIGVSVDKALRVMQCETAGTGNPDIVNYEGSGASGLFQHMPQFWAGRSAAAGYVGADIFDPDANVAVAAYLVARDGWDHWPNCGKK